MKIKLPPVRVFPPFTIVAFDSEKQPLGITIYKWDKQTQNELARYYGIEAYDGLCLEGILC